MFRLVELWQSYYLIVLHKLLRNIGHYRLYVKQRLHSEDLV